MLRTLFVMDPLDRIRVSGDSTYMQMLDASRRGWPVWMCTPSELYAQQGRTWARATPVQTIPEAPHFITRSPEARDLAEFDVVWMRKDPPFDIEYVFATYMLDMVPSSTHVFNSPAALRNHNEKLFALRWPELCPPTLITAHIEQAIEWAATAPDKVVIKPWDGMAGRGVLVTRHGDPNLRAMLELLTERGRRSILVQHHVPEIRQGDKRVILIDGEPRGQVLRVPQPGDHRGNMHVGARVAACELTDRDRHICAAIGPQLRREGLVFVGIDIIGPYLTEINVTSPTGIQEINALMDRSLEVELTDAVVGRVESADPTLEPEIKRART